MRTALSNRGRKEFKLNREQARQNLVTIGVAEPTDDQITNYLNQLNGETKKEKDRADKYKSEAEEVIELRKQLEEKDNASLTEVEKLQKEIEKLKSDNEAQILLNKNMTMKANLAKQGIVDEDADKLIESINSGSFDADILGKIISDREAKAVSQKEKELLDGTPNPDGKKNGNDNDSDPLISSIAQNMARSNKESENIISAYL